MTHSDENHTSYRAILHVSLPMVVTMGSIMVMEFTDRIFLARYSLDAIAAALPAGIAAFLIISFFMGVAGYVNVFVAQYTGAGIREAVGSMLWQGIWFSALASVALMACAIPAEWLFALVGHDPAIQALEVEYYRIFCLGGGLYILAVTLSCFFSGRGKTRIVMLFHVITMLINIPLDYALINGVWIFPAMGIRGAAIATVTAWALLALMFSMAVFTDENDRRFGVRRNRALQWPRLKRLLVHGVPSALQFCLDIMAFTFFLFVVGRMGATALATTNIVISMNSIAFMPMVGFSIGVSTLVGQALGRGRPEDAATVTRRTTHITLGYITLMILVYLCLPGPIIDLFRPAGAGPEFLEIRDLGIALLRFVSLYIVFDAHYMVYIGALKGAGDTRFIMISAAVALALGIVAPLSIGIAYFNAGIFYAWSCLTIFIFGLFIASLWRYRKGNWRERRMVEEGPADGPQG